MIVAGRVLTGVMPRDINQTDFRAFTCGLSKFVRRSTEVGGEDRSALRTAESAGEGMLSNAAWMNGKGVAGGWDCLLNSDCTHLPGGEERGWHFSGDETIGDVEQDWMKSMKDDNLIKEKARGKDILEKL
ncbi:hypothetical protein MMC31_000075 [Peltigera leucophlebia]|nr:hypothetical protein [Peltigera leucophlebia]